MAIKQILTDLDLSKNKLRNAIVDPVADDVALTTLAATLTAADEGLIKYNLDDNKLYTFDGTNFVTDDTDKEVMVVTSNPLNPALTGVDPAVEQVAWVETQNGVKYCHLYKHEGGDVLSPIATPVSIYNATVVSGYVAPATADTTKTNSYQTLANGSVVYVNQFGQVQPISIEADLGAITIENASITGGTPYEVNVQTLLGSEMAQEFAYMFKVSDTTGMDVQSQDVDDTKFYLLTNQDVTSCDILVIVKKKAA